MTLTFTSFSLCRIAKNLKNPGLPRAKGTTTDTSRCLLNCQVMIQRQVTGTYIFIVSLIQSISLQCDPNNGIILQSLCFDPRVHLLTRLPSLSRHIFRNSSITAFLLLNVSSCLKAQNLLHSKLHDVRRTDLIERFLLTSFRAAIPSAFLKH